MDLFPFYGVNGITNTISTQDLYSEVGLVQDFNTLSQAVCWILKNNYGVSHILHLLDDFLAADTHNAEADRTMAIFSLVFNNRGIALRLPT